MKATVPKIETLEAQHYIGVRTQIPMHDMPTVIPALIEETEAWLLNKGKSLSEAPLIRYHVIDMEKELDIEIGWPVDEAMEGDDRVNAGVIPAGLYGSLIYWDINKGIEGNKILIDWAEDEGIQWDTHQTDKGQAFGGRFEFFLDGPENDPNPANWRTKVAIKIDE